MLPIYTNGIDELINLQVPTVVNGNALLLPYVNSLYKEPGRDFFALAINKISNAHDLDFLSKMDANDAEIYLMNSSEVDDVIHHVIHSRKIRDVSNSMNRPITIGDVKTPRIQAEERIIDFCKRKFGI